jgi:hypothetical protein
VTFVEPTISIPDFANLIGVSHQYMYQMLSRTPSQKEHTATLIMGPPTVERGQQRLIRLSDAREWLEERIISMSATPRSKQTRTYKAALKAIKREHAVAYALQRFYRPIWADPLPQEITVKPDVRPEPKRQNPHPDMTFGNISVANFATGGKL